MGANPHPASVVPAGSNRQLPGEDFHFTQTHDWPLPLAEDGPGLYWYASVEEECAPDDPDGRQDVVGRLNRLLVGWGNYFHLSLAW